MKSVLLFVLIALYVDCCLTLQATWLHWGGNKENWRFTNHSCIDSKQLSTLSTTKPLWKLKTTGTVAATPAVCGGHVFYVDWGRTIAKVTLKGQVVWEVDAKTFLPAEKKVGVRVSPVLNAACTELYVATQWTANPWLLTMDAATGKLKYPPVKIDAQPNSRITSSPVLYQGNLIIGVSSNVENNFELTKCCTWRGNVVSINVATGKVVWQTFLTPTGWSGVPVWGSSPAIDAGRNQVCVGTGNLYSIPKAAVQCLKAAPDGSAQQKACMPSTVYTSSIVCLSLSDGKIKWGTRVHPIDIWGNAFDTSAPDIKAMFPKYKGVVSLDHDFAQGPIFIKDGAGVGKDILVVSSKAGLAFGFDPATGKVIWSTILSLASDHKPGYSMFGSCSNGKIFCSGLHWFGSPSMGRVSCMNVATGKKIWTKDWQWQAGVFGPLTCSQKHVFVPTLDKKGTLAVLDIATGIMLGSYKTGASLFCGPAIVNGVMYVGNGYGNGGEPGDSIMAVALPGCGQPYTPGAGGSGTSTPTPAGGPKSTKPKSPKKKSPKKPGTKSKVAADASTTAQTSG